MLTAANPPQALRGPVRSFDFVNQPGMSQCPFATLSPLHEGPDIFWNSAGKFGGSWVLTRAEDIRKVLLDNVTFASNQQAGIAQLLGESWDLIPIELGPPDHAKYRQALMPYLTPAVVKRMTPDIRRRCIGLIEAATHFNRCEFQEAFGRPFPIGVFMNLMGMPGSDIDHLIALEFQLMHSSNLDDRIASAHAVRDYLRDFGNAKRQNPAEDLGSCIANLEIDGNLVSETEVLSMLFVFFIGGLDTVAATTGFIFRHLAEHPELQRTLRTEPDRIAAAVDELLRRFSVVTSHRRATRDVEISGVKIAKNEWVTISTALGSLDPSEFGDPLNVDLDRKAPRHLAFEIGPHFCMGMHLARCEIQIALEEWLARVPQWRIDGDVKVHGAQFGVDRLPLAWSLPNAAQGNWN